MRKLALKYQIAIFWFYGEPGHGRGLVDAMSSFGCKENLRSPIITQDKWFDTAEEMAEYLREHFRNDNSKSFHVIHASDIANLRKQKKDEFIIPGCRKMHLIAVSSNGTFINRTVLDTSDSKLLERNIFDSNDDEELPLVLQILGKDGDNEVDNDEIIDNADIIDGGVLFSIITPFVALRAAPKSLESFYVMKVVSKDIASEHLLDGYGQAVVFGEKFITGFYLNKYIETKKEMRFSLPKKPISVSVHLEEIFTTNVEVLSDLTMDIIEYEAIN